MGKSLCTQLFYFESNIGSMPIRFWVTWLWSRPPAAEQSRICHYSQRNSSEASRTGKRWDFYFFCFNSKPQHEVALLIWALLCKACVRTTFTTFVGCWDALKVTAVLNSSTVLNESFNAMKGKFTTLIYTCFLFDPLFMMLRTQWLCRIQFHYLLHRADGYKVVNNVYNTP